VRYEDVVRQPEAQMQRLCSALGLDYQPSMTQPYQDGKGRMTDGIHPESRMLGDVKFLQYRGIEAGAADRWRQSLADDSLSPLTRDLASLLGYDDLQPARRNGEGTRLSTIQRLARDEEVEQTLGRLDQLSEKEVDALLSAALAEEGASQPGLR
jgi:hypothetical protein